MSPRARAVRGLGAASRAVPIALLLLAATALWPATAAAQSVVAGSVEGTIVDEADFTVARAEVTLLETRTAISRTVTGDSEGRFGFTFVPPGVYTLRIEALGFRPRLVTGVPVGPGETVRVRVDLIGEPPPVTRIDTVSWDASGVGGAWPGIGRRVEADEVRDLPDRRFGLAPLVELDSRADAIGGYQGRPAGSSVIVSEGEPFRSAGHPTGLTSAFGFPFPRIGVSGLDVSQGLDDIEWGGANGAVIPVRTRPAPGRDMASGYVLGAGGGMWSSEAVDDPPGLTSFWGGADVAIPLLRDTSTLYLAAEGGRIQTAQPTSAADSVVSDLLAAGADEGTGVREMMAASGMARVDWALANGGQIGARAGFSTFEQTLDRRQGPGVQYGVETPVKGTDMSISGAAATPINDEVQLEVRGSVGFSSRDYEADSEIPGAWVVGRRARIGPDPSFPASVSRLDIGGGPVAHYRSGPHRIKGGLRFDLASHDVTYASSRLGAYGFGSVSDLLEGEGWFTRAVGNAPVAEFSVPQISAFGQYRWNAAPGIDLTAGFRWTRETLPTDEVRPALAWIELTGLSNVGIAPEKVDAFDARMHVQWDVQGDRKTWVTGGMAVQHGGVDPFHLAEWLTLDGGIRVQRGVGDVGSWPSLPDSASAPVFGTRLALMSPDLEPSRTVRGTAALVRELSPGLSAGVSGSFRRTENLLRRFDLNGLVRSIGSDQFGRPLYGDLSITGGVLAADPATNRRFQGFESVWALEPDGWSEYRGFSFFVDLNLPGGASMGGSYTWSETTDNLVGAAAGRPEAQIVTDHGIEGWEEGVSDFDIPSRLTLTGALPVPAGGTLSAVYQFRSGRPFTPMVAAGLDANGDGSYFNDPAWIPSGGLDENALSWDCVGTAQGTLPLRNSCRGDAVHRLDLRLSIGLGTLPFQLVVDGLNLTDAQDGVRDDGLLILDPSGSLTRSGNDVNVPYRVNPGFGSFLVRTDPGRMLRVGIRFGGGS